ncbi:MAG: acylphosphatase [Candidatus Peregrinibacteria bacterium]
MPAVAKLFKITGQVQHVFFRANTRTRARTWNINGWIRNNSDGTVEVLAEGDEEGLKKMEEWCRTGPPAAQVESVTVTDLKPKGLREFEAMAEVHQVGAPPPIG